MESAESGKVAAGGTLTPALSCFSLATVLWMIRSQIRTLVWEENGMREAVIVSYARTGLAKSGRGGFNITPTVTMAAHVVKHAVERAGSSRRRSKTASSATSRTAPTTRGPLRRPCSAACRSPPPASPSTASVPRACSPSPWPRAMSIDDGANVVVAGGMEFDQLPRRRRFAREQRPAPDRHISRLPHADDRHGRHRRRALQGQPRVPGRISRWNPSAAWPPPSRPASSRTRSSR